MYLLCVVSPAVQFLTLVFAGWVNRKQAEALEYLKAENRALREQLGDRPLRFTDAERRRLARAARRVGRQGLLEIGPIVTPDTLQRWYRRLVAAKYDGSASRRTGRPSTSGEITELIVRMAVENPRWGYTRIRGALYNLGRDVGRNTIRRVLAEHGIDPAPQRSRRTSWATFLRSHWGAISATDFFTVELLRPTGLVRYLVLFVIDLKSRRIDITGIAPVPDGRWMAQIARNLTDAETGCLRDAKFLIHDRDPLFTREFRLTLEAAGVKPIRLPPRSPNLNAYAERFVRSIKSECLAQVIPLSERHLQRVVTEYADHYNFERNHQGLENHLVDSSRHSLRADGAVRRQERLGGLLNYYYREAA